MPTDTNVSNLIINVLDEQQYEQIQNPSRTELYLVPEVVDTVPTENSTNTVTSGGVYDAINNAKKVYWCYWDDDNNTVTGLTPEQIYQLTQDGCIVKCKMTNTSGDDYIFTLQRCTFSQSNYEIIFSQCADVNTRYVNSYTIRYENNAWAYIEAVYNVQSDWNQSNNDAPDYIKNKPIIPDAVSGQNDGTNWTSITIGNTTKAIPQTDTILPPQSGNEGKFLTTNGSEVSWDGVPEQVNADWEASSGPSEILNKPTIPTVNNNTVTIQRNGTTIDSFTLNASSDKIINIDGVQDQITSVNKLSADLVEDGTTNKVFTSTEKTKLEGIEDGAEANVQADWNQTTTTADDYIKNKPVIVEKLDDLSDVEISDGGTIEQTYFEDAVEDYDGNWYDAVIIGNQVWLAENLRTTHYVDGTAITNGGNSSGTNPYYYNNGDSEIPLRKRGLFYNWYATTKSNKILLNGWHIPTNNEFSTLRQYCQTYYQSVTKALASTDYWNTSAVNNSPGKNPEENNVSLFTAVPVGGVTTNPSFTGEGNYCGFWVTNAYNSNEAYAWGISRGDISFDNANYFSSCGCSVRCVCNLTATEFREQMGLRGKVLVNDGEKWVAGDMADITIQSDWNQTTTTAPDYIKNKPSIPTIGLENFNNADWDYVFTI